MEQLPAIDLDNNFYEPIILKASEPEQIIDVIAQPTASHQTGTPPEVSPRGVEEVQIVKPIIVEQNETVVEVVEKVVEKIENVVAHESEVITTSKVEEIQVERPIVARTKRAEVQEPQLPTYDFKDEIKAEAPAVVEQKTKPNIEKTKEVPREITTEKPKVTEIFRRRGRERYTVELSAKRRYEEPAEEIRTERPSIAESAVEQTLARFAAEMVRERPTPVEDTDREPVAEAKIIVVNENDPIAEVVQELPIMNDAEQIITEKAPRVTASVESENVVPSPAFARAENAPKTQIENILEQLRLPRTVAAPEVMQAANENLRTTSVGNFPLTDDADKQPRVRTMKSGPITMRMAA